MVKFPQEPGFYFWYYADMNYFEIGAVQVLKDSEKHLKYLATLPLFRDSGWPGIKYASPYVFKNDKGENLTMDWQANGGDSPHYPTFKKDSVEPIVDGFIPFDFNELLDKTLK